MISKRLLNSARTILPITKTTTTTAIRSQSTSLGLSSNLHANTKSTARSFSTCKTVLFGTSVTLYKKKGKSSGSGSASGGSGSNSGNNKGNSPMLTEDVDLVDLPAYSQKLSNCVKYLESEYSKLQVGKPNPALLKDIVISSHKQSGRPGGKLSNLANISIKDGKNLLVIPTNLVDYTMRDYDTAIRTSNVVVGLNPITNAEANTIVVPIPKPSKETRVNLTKQVNNLAEAQKVVLRKHRQECQKLLKTNSAKYSGVSKDDTKYWQDEIENATKKYIDMITNLSNSKIKDIGQA